MIVLLVSGQIKQVSSPIDEKSFPRYTKDLFLEEIKIRNPFILALLPTDS